MLKTTRWTTTLAAAGVLLLGGLTAGTSQEAEEPALDVDGLAEQMELGDEARAELAKLGDLLQRRTAMREAMAGLRTEMRETMEGLTSRLTVEQFRELHRRMRATMQMGPPGAKGAQGGAMMRGGGHRGMHGGHMRGTGPGAGMGGGTGTCPWLQGAAGQDGGDGTP